MGTPQPTRQARPKVTLDDVAAAAGVSPATASRALNGVATVRPASAEAVRAAAAALGYRPNAAARSLARGRFDSIALVVPESDFDAFTGSFFAQPLRGATKAVADHGMQLVMLVAQHEDDVKLVRFLDSANIDGALVVIEAHSTYLATTLASTQVPVVYLGRPVATERTTYSYVDSDNYGGARLAVAALADAGRHQIATVAGPSDMGVAVDRERGWRDELASRGLLRIPAVHGDFSAPSGAAAMGRLLAAAPELDAVFVASDFMAMGALRVLQAAGRRVPQDVAVVSYDDTVLAASAHPPLTSVRQPLEEMGRMLVEVLLELIDDPDHAPIQRIVPATLTVRESV